MHPIIFIFMVSIVSRLIWSRRYPYENLRSEVTYFGLIVIFTALWFAYCVWAFGFKFP
jgi:hypothetical protein